NTGWTTAAILDGNAAMVHRQEQGFDALGRLHEILGNAGQVTRFVRDENDNPIEVRENQGETERVTAQAFDALNRLSRMTRPDNSVVSYTYDTQGQLAQVIDPRNSITQYHRNGFGEIIEFISPDTGVTRYTYDTAGNVIERRDARDVVTQYQYDALNRLTHIRYPHSPPGAPLENVTYAYDQNTYGVGRLSRITDESGETQYAYDHRGNIISDVHVIGQSLYRTLRTLGALYAR
ncbi:MAG: RHS repeat protein, partial [Gammaproteobacteria bacterium]